MSFAHFLLYFLYPPKTLFVVGTLFSCCPCVRPCVRPSVRKVLFPSYLEESLLDFHQTLQTCSYMQDKYFRQKSKGKGPVLLELFLFVVLNGFLYLVLCLCYYRPYTGGSTPTTAIDGAI